MLAQKTTTQNTTRSQIACIPVASPTSISITSSIFLTDLSHSFVAQIVDVLL